MWRGPTAGGRARAHDAERARACSWAARVRRRVPLPGAWLLLVGVTLAVWVGCCARRREWHRRRRRESSGGLAREEHDARDARPLQCAALCSRWLGRGGMCRAVPRPAAARGRTMQSELARAAGRRACGVGSPCRARGSSSCRRDACRVGWVLCTPQSMTSATTARELWRRRSRRTRRSRSSKSKVRGSVLAVAGSREDVARSHGRRPRAGARCRASSRVQLGGARAASGPLAGRVAPPLVGVTLAVWVGCCERRSQ
jgi:hypothetical protein